MQTDLYYYDWHKVLDSTPYKGQIVEVLVYMPAIYEGQNEYGCYLWDQIDGLDRVVYWRIPQDAIIYPYVQKKLLERTQQND